MPLRRFPNKDVYEYKKAMKSTIVTTRFRTTFYGKIHVSNRRKDEKKQNQFEDTLGASD